MTLSQAIREKIKLTLKEKQMTAWALFKASAVPCSTISTFMTGKTELIKLDTFQGTLSIKGKVNSLNYLEAGGKKASGEGMLSKLFK